MLSSKNEPKLEARFSARLDVLSERVDTLASTVATTASSIVKKDGEIAALRKELDQREQRLADLMTQAREASGGRAIAELQAAVAALAKGRSTSDGTKDIDDIAAKVALLAQRLETLSTTVSTTAAGLAGREGELATIRKRLDSAATAAPVRSTAAPDAQVVRQLDELSAAVHNTQQRVEGQAAELESLKGQLTEQQPPTEETRALLSTLGDRVEGQAAELESLKGQLAEPNAPAEETQAALATLRDLVEGQAAELESLKGQLAEPNAPAEETQAALATLRDLVEGQAAELESLKGQLAEPNAPAEEIRAMLATLRDRVESLTGLRSGVTDEQLDERIAEIASSTSTSLDELAQRVDALAEGVEEATASLADKEHELAALHRHLTESSSKIETIVDDLRAALAAFADTSPEALPTFTAQLESATETVDAVSQRVDRLEAARVDEAVAELAERIDRLDKRLETASAEIGRAKTLWPVALRSLEARLDDAAPTRKPESEPESESGSEPRLVEKPTAPAAPRSQDEDEDAPAEDLLASLRDSLRVMEDVAAEMERASEPWSSDDTEAPDLPTTQQAVAGGARIVPLRASDP